MNIEIGEETRRAREAAEGILDGLMDLLNDQDLAPMPTEKRFEFLMTALMRSKTDQVVMAAIAIVALERLHLKEQLDQDLSER